MTKCRAIVFFTLILTLVLGVNAVAEPGNGVAVRANSGPFFQQDVTTMQVALFAQFFASGQFEEQAGPIVTAISISNILAAPAGPSFEDFETAPFREGTIEFFLWNQNGDVIHWETSDDSVGAGLNMDGTLSPGGTYTVLLEEVLAAAGYVDDEDVALPFAGYGWVVCNWDAAQGTYNLAFWEIGFTQNFSFEPTMGTGGIFFGGIPVIVDPVDDDDDDDDNGNGNGGE